MAVGGNGLSNLRVGARPEVDPPVDVSTSPRYDAFLSYAHESDARVADRLRWGLQRLGRPFWRTSPRLRVFLDKTTMSANSALWPSICSALDRSEWFVLLASPASARSRWVGRELERWLATKPVDRLLVVVTDGTVVWDDEAGDIDLERSTALHPALAGAFTHEPRLTDLRWVDDDGDLTLSNPAFVEAVADVGAAVHGVPKETLDGAELRERRRSRRALQTTVAVLAVLLAMTLVAAAVAVRELRESERAQDLAVARLLAARSDELAPTDPGLAMLLAATAWDFAPIPEVRAAMLRRGSQPLIGTITPPRRTQLTSAVSPDRPRIAMASKGPHSSTSFSLVDAATGQAEGPPITLGIGDAHVVAHGPRGLVAIVSAPTFRAGDEQILEVWDTDERRWTGAGVGMSSGRTVKAAVFSPDGQTLAVSADAGFDSSGSTVTLLDTTATGRPIELSVDRHVSDLAFRPDHQQLAIADIHGGIELRDLASPENAQEIAPPGAPGALSQRIAFDPGGTRLVSTDGRGTRLWDLRPARPETASLDVQGATAVTFSADGAQVIGVVGSDVRFWDVATREVIGPSLDVDDRSPSTSIAVTGDGRYLVVSSSQAGTIHTWDLHRYRRTGATIRVPGDDAATAFPDTTRPSPDGTRWVAGGPDGLIRLWSSVALEEPALLPGQVPVEGNADDFPLAWTPDGEALVAATGDDSMIQSWNVASQERGPDLLPGDGTGIRDLAISPDGLVLAALLEGAELHLWNIDTWERSRPSFMVGNESAGNVPERIWFGPDNTLYALLPGSFPDTNDSGAVVPWDLTSGRPGASLRVGNGYDVTRLAVTGDGRWLGVIIENDVVAVWDLEQRVAVYEEPGSSDDDRPERLALRDDGRALAYMAADGTIRVVSLATGDEVARMPAPYQDQGVPGDAVGMGFRSGSDLLTVAWRNGSMTTWHVPVPGDLVGELCDVAGRSMTAEEWEHHVGDGDPRDVCAGR